MPCLSNRVVTTLLGFSPLHQYWFGHENTIFFTYQQCWGSDLYVNPVSIADKLAWLGACPFISRAQFSHLFNGELS